MMIAFLANTPETLGWLFTHLVQSPKLLEKVRAECDAVGDVEPTAPFLKLTPHLYSALFETCRLYVFTGIWTPPLCSRDYALTQSRHASDCRQTHEVAGDG